MNALDKQYTDLLQDILDILPCPDYLLKEFVNDIIKNDE